MTPKIYEAIDQAVAGGATAQQAANTLITQGWQKNLVEQTLKNWLTSNGRIHSKTDFNAWIKKYTRQTMPYIISVSISCIFVTITTLLKPWPTKIMVDSAFGGKPAPLFLEPYSGTTTLILFTAILTIVIFLMATIFNTLRDYLLIRYSYGITKNVREETFRHILNIPAYKGQYSKGDYIHRQNNLTGAISDYSLNTRVGIIQASLTIMGIIIIMLFLSTFLALITAFLIPLIFIVTKFISPKISKFGKQFNQNSASATSLITESIDNAETIQSFDMADRQLGQVKTIWDQNFSILKLSLYAGRLFHFTNNLSVVLAIAIVMYVGGASVLSGKITLGELLIFMTYMGYLLGPVQNIANQISLRSQKKNDAIKVHQILQDHEGIEEAWENRHFPFQKGTISFQNVSYAYSSYTVLHDINITIEAGQKVAIIGPSGSGKSTLLKLLDLFLEPTGGRIMIDGIDIQSISLKELRSKIAIANQFPQLFNNSLIENVLDGSPSHRIPRESLDYLLNVTGISEFSKHFPDGLQTKAGENGSNLSGGQKQRVALARALAKQTPILCLDEPTASLDSNSEIEIKNALSQVIGHKTVILVSHRHALLELMDAIYVLENGTLKHINEVGGLDNYLAKMNDTESKITIEQTRLEEARLVEKIQRERQAAELSALQQQNNELLQKIAHTENNPQNRHAEIIIQDLHQPRQNIPQQTNGTDEGVTLVINH
jgi:ABC-type multidrug transport system fused ATPase/permease subunit